MWGTASVAGFLTTKGRCGAERNGNVPEYVNAVAQQLRKADPRNPSWTSADPGGWRGGDGLNSGGCLRSVVTVQVSLLQMGAFSAPLSPPLGCMAGTTPQHETASGSESPPRVCVQTLQNTS